MLLRMAAGSGVRQVYGPVTKTLYTFSRNVGSNTQVEVDDRDGEAMLRERYGCCGKTSIAFERVPQQ